jgi:hypothetical protein
MDGLRKSREIYLDSQSPSWDWTGTSQRRSRSTKHRQARSCYFGHIYGENRSWTLPPGSRNQRKEETEAIRDNSSKPFPLFSQQWTHLLVMKRGKGGGFTWLQLGELPWHIKKLLHALKVLILISLEHFNRIRCSLKRMLFFHSLHHKHTRMYRYVCLGPRPPTKLSGCISIPRADSREWRLVEIGCCIHWKYIQNLW